MVTLDYNKNLLHATACLNAAYGVSIVLPSLSPIYTVAIAIGVIVARFTMQFIHND